MLWLIGDVCHEQYRENMTHVGYKSTISGVEIHEIPIGWHGLNVASTTWRQQDCREGRHPHRDHLLKMDKLHGVNQMIWLLVTFC